MPSKSKAQQRFMGLVHAYKKGEVPTSKVSKSVKDAAKSMSKKDTEKYASTKHKGLPNKVKKEMLKKLREMIRLELETCGYTHSVTGRKLKSPGGTGPEDRDLKESVDPKVKKQASALLKRYTNNWKKLEKETEMLMKFAKKNKATEMVMNFEEVLKKLKGSVWDNVRYQTEKPMDDYFYESVNKSKDENDYLKNQALTQEEVTKSKGVEKIFDIQKNGYGKLGGRTLDSLSAGLFTQLYDKASDPIKEKMNKLNEKRLYIVIGNMWKKFGKNVSLR